MTPGQQEQGAGEDPAAPAAAVTPPASPPEPAAEPDPARVTTHIPAALRLLRTREDLTQKAAAQKQGAPNLRTICHWETGRKTPSLKPLIAYLCILGLDFCDLQDALNEVREPHPAGCRMAVERLETQVAEMERRLRRVEGRPSATSRGIRPMPTSL